MATLKSALRRIVFVVCSSVIGLAAGPGLGQADADGADWRARPHLTGSWGGVRDSLGERGLDPFASYTAGVWSNAHGGFATGTRYEGFALAGFAADLERLVGWTGGRFFFAMHSYHGGQPSSDLVGVFSTTEVSGWEADTSFRFSRIFLQQEWLGGRLTLKAGQIAADSDFFIAAQSDTLLNATFGFLGLARAVQVVPLYPLAAPGVYASVRPLESWYLRGGAYVADVGNDTARNIGFDWSFDGGASFVGEVGTEQRPWGRAGRYAVGVVETTATIFDYRKRESVDDALGFYGLVDQALLVDGRNGVRLGAFLQAEVTTQEERSNFLWILQGGLRWVGAIPGLDRDVVSFGSSYFRFTDDYVDYERAQGRDVTRSQLALELTYRLQATGWLSVQPDLQVFVDPQLSRRDAVVLGLQLAIAL